MFIFYNLPLDQYGNNKIIQRKKIVIEESLFARIAKDDWTGLEELYTLTDKAVYAFALSILKNPDDAQDVMQETYLKIRSAAHLYQPMGKPLAWIFTIVRNLCFMKIRSEKRISEKEEQDNSIHFSYMEEKEDRILIQSMLTILSEEERQILVLHAVSGMKHNEIANLMKLKLSTVLSKYNRSLKKLKKYLKEGGIFVEKN